MDTVLLDVQSSATFTGMNFGWGPDSYAATYGTSDFPDADLWMPMGDANSRYAPQKTIIAI
jgi:hypothetical protein